MAGCGELPFFEELRFSPHSAADSLAADKLTILETESCKPQSCADPLQASTTTEARRDRKKDLLPESEAALNGPA
uniref:Uncharacterized protein n=1 Tax=Sphaerodactylus townsendi TaxID=933632 RepID=A0ACB8FL30_9SAUR